jgi:hypothetical protein
MKETQALTLDTSKMLGFKVLPKGKDGLNAAKIGKPAPVPVMPIKLGAKIGKP